MTDTEKMILMNQSYIMRAIGLMFDNEVERYKGFDVRPEVAKELLNRFDITQEFVLGTVVEVKP